MAEFFKLLLVLGKGSLEGFEFIGFGVQGFLGVLDVDLLCSQVAFQGGVLGNGLDVLDVLVGAIGGQGKDDDPKDDQSVLSDDGENHEHSSRERGRLPSPARA